MSEPRVSIVVPVYNDAATVGRALESALGQTLAALEVVVVDDASTDDTPEVLARYASRDARVRVVRHPENRQLLEARRTGVAQSRAPYVAFLDADDWLDADFAERSHAEAEKARADVVCFPIVCEYEGETPPPEVAEGRARMYACPDLVARGADVTHATYRDDKVVWSLCGKLYSRTCLERAFGRISARRMFQCEDAYTYFLVTYVAQTLVAVSDAPAYRYSVGCGDTRADARDLTAREYARICECGGAAVGVGEFLATCPDADAYADDVAQLRFRLLADPTSRFPGNVAPAERPAAFEALLASWPPDEALGWLAARQWDDPAPCVLAAAQSRLPHARGAGVGVLWAAGDGDVGWLAALVDALAHGCGLHVTVLVDEGADTGELPEGVGGVILPGLGRTTGGRYPERSRALAAAIAREGLGAVVLCGWARISLPWDALVAKASGARVVLWPGDVRSLLARGAIPGQRGLPETCALADAVACPASEAAFWRQFGACVFTTPHGRPYGDPAFWRSLLSASAGATHASGGVPPDACELRGVWDGVLAALAERSAAERVTSERLRTLEQELERRDAQFASIRAEADSLRDELADVRGSFSFRAGRIITAPLRVLRDAVVARGGA